MAVAKAQHTAERHGFTRFVSMQNHYNLVYREEEREMIPLEADFAVVDRVVEVAREHGVPPAQVVLAWLLHRPGVTAPIVGATKLGHVEDAIAAEQLDLADDEISRLEEPYTPHRVLGHG